MTQETTKELGFRISQALEAHPMAPPTPHGRLSWLKRELEGRGTKVSVNTVHKWVHGLSRPRGDNLQELAKALKVDEVWLSLGRKPNAGQTTEANATQAKGAVLLVAGLIEVNGGRVTFGEGETPHLYANLGGEQFGVIAVAPQGRDGNKVSFVIPEPVGKSQVLAVVQGPALAVSLLDLTDVPRQNLGGFSLVTLTRRTDGKFKVPEQRNLLAPLASVEELAA